MNDGQNGPLETLVTGYDSKSPNLASFVIDLSTNGVVGSIYKFKIRAENFAGTIDTNALSVALASLPDKPESSPLSDPAITNQNTVSVTFELFTSANNGGSEIILYEIQHDDGDRGDFNSVYQLSNRLTIATGIVPSAEYRFRYRA
jgi:hypothetical protein